MIERGRGAFPRRSTERSCSGKCAHGRGDRTRDLCDNDIFALQRTTQKWPPAAHQPMPWACARRATPAAVWLQRQVGLGTDIPTTRPQQPTRWLSPSLPLSHTHTHESTIDYPTLLNWRSKEIVIPPPWVAQIWRSKTARGWLNSAQDRSAECAPNLDEVGPDLVKFGRLRGKIHLAEIGWFRSKHQPNIDQIDQM